MSFRLVPNALVLDDLEWRNRPNRRVILPNLVAIGADCVNVVEDTPILSAAEKVGPKIVFNDISFMGHGDIVRGSPPARALK